MKAANAIAKTLKKLGIDTVFSVTGGGAMYLNDAMASELNVIYCHHEQACAIAAEGYYRASGKVACVNVTTGPGGLNTLTGVMGQWTDSIPVVYVSGQVNYDTTITGHFEANLRQVGDQEVNIIAAVESLTKFAVQLKSADNIPAIVTKVYEIAISGRMGPVWIDVPMNIQGATVFPQGEKIHELIASAKSPVIIAGHGIRLSGAVDLFKKFLDVYQIPVVTTFNGFDLLPSDHHQFMGTIGSVGRRAGNIVLQNADLILVLGSRNNIRQVSYKWNNFAKNAIHKIIVDIDKNELSKSTVKPTVALEMNVYDFIDSMMDHPVIEKKHWMQWCRDIQNKYNGIDAIDNPLYNFFYVITNNLPQDAIAVCANGSACVGMFQSGVVKDKSRFFWNSGCAAMGYDLPAAIGAYVATKKPILCFAGDGSMQMNLQELQTIVHHNMDIKIFYLNNNGYTSIKQTQDNYFTKRSGCDPASGVSFPPIQSIASAYGIKYLCLMEYDAFGDLIEDIYDYHGPILIEVKLPSDYVFEPKLKAQVDENGVLVAPSLENMWPFLTADELRSNIYQGENA